LSEAPTDDDGHACVYVRFSGTFLQLIRMERDLRRIKKRVRRINRQTLLVCLPLPLPRSLPPFLLCLQWTCGKSSRPSRRSSSGMSLLGTFQGSSPTSTQRPSLDLSSALPAHKSMLLLILIDFVDFCKTGCRSRRGLCFREMK
jgi:hypothetical protein